MVLSKSLILRFFCRFVGKNVTKFLCYIDLLKVTKLKPLGQRARVKVGSNFEENLGNRLSSLAEIWTEGII